MAAKWSGERGTTDGGPEFREGEEDEDCRSTASREEARQKARDGTDEGDCRLAASQDGSREEVQDEVRERAGKEDRRSTAARGET